MNSDLKLWQRIDSLRELLQHGGSLLGETATLARNAELSLSALSSHKATIDGLRCELNLRGRELEEARQRLKQLQAEVDSLRLMRRADVPQVLRSPGYSEMERRLRLLETELEQTRTTLASERERRNRAISLIRPADGAPADEGIENAGPVVRAQARL